MNIALHMEHLQLDGVELRPGQCAQLQEALQAELARLLGTGGLAPALTQGGQVAQLAAPAIVIAPGVDAARLGRQIAQSVFDSFDSPPAVGTTTQSTVGKQ